MPDVFISYVRRSTEREARQIEAALRAAGYDVWRDVELPPHRAFTEVIEERLKAARAVVVIWSAEAVKSEWVQSEADHARIERKLVQLTVDGSTPPMPFDRIQCADLVDWKGDPGAAGWRTVLESVGELVGRAPHGEDVELTGRHDGPSRAPASTSASAATKPRPARRWMAVLAAAVAVVAIAAAGWWFIGRSSVSPPPAKVAVLPFDTGGQSQDGDAFAAGLLDEILGALSNDHVQTISRTEGASLRGADAGAAIQRLGVGLLLDGSVEQANGSITVRLHLDDAREKTAIWSETFSRVASESDALQAEVAAKAARIISQALGARAAGVTDPATLSDFVTGDEHQRFDLAGGSAAGEPFFRRVVARAPSFAGGHAYLAIADAFESYEPGNPRAAEQRLEADREAHEAIRLDPRGDNAFLALSMITPPDAEFFRTREATLQKGMTGDPTEPAYPYFLGQALAQEGRLQAGAEYLRRSVAGDAYWPGPTDYLALYLMETGQADEGQRLLDRMQRLWPQNWATLSGRFWAAALYGDPGVAIALLASPGTRPPFVDSRTADLWRTSLSALKSDRPGARASQAAAVRAAARAGQFPPTAAVWLLVRLGDLDGAFGVANQFPATVAVFDLNGPPILFSSATAPLRRDPRFMALAAKLGLVHYWRSTGNWPDFCSEPGLPYDCKAEAAKF